MIKIPSPSEEIIEASNAVSVKAEHDLQAADSERFVRDQPHLSASFCVFLLTQPGSQQTVRSHIVLQYSGMMARSTLALNSLLAMNCG